MQTCHTGNTKIFTAPNGATLYAGGWMRGAQPAPAWGVIDLTGRGPKTPRTNGPAAMNEAAKTAFASTLAQPAPAPWRDAYIPDFGTPDWLPETWDSLALDVATLLEKGTSLLVACEGGHGRTGLFLAILLNRLGRLGVMPPLENPVTWLRAHYCAEVVETVGQMRYIAHLTGLPHLEAEPPAKFYTPQPLAPYARHITVAPAKKHLTTLAETECPHCLEEMDENCRICGQLICAYCTGLVCHNCEKNLDYTE